jgi:plastocyanin
MRRRLLLLSVVALALVAVACANASTPGWTYAPPTAPPASQAAPSGEPSAAPSGEPSAAPSGEPASAAPSGDGGSAAGTVVQITAQNIQFQQSEVSAPADAAFTIHFSNQDPSTPHDVVIKDSSGAVKFQGAVTTGPAETDYQVPALPAGTYQFVCSIHPNMVGTLKVGG